MTQGIEGIILVDKPADMTSAKVVWRIKSLFNVKKAGHAGTLDPFATGLMICCLNRATRLARFFLSGDKTYEALLQLGMETDTQDFTGRPLGVTKVPLFSEKRIATTFKMFTGTIQQTPPVYSALKHKGIPLYQYARSGKAVQKPARQVTISKMTLREINLPQVRFEVSCSAGTYIRTLCADIGSALGCGGHLKALKRLASSGFHVEDAVTLKALEKAGKRNAAARHVIPPAAALKGMTEWTADSRLKDKIVNGVPLSPKDAPSEVAEAAGDFIKIIDDHKELLAVVQNKKEPQQYNYCCVFN